MASVTFAQNSYAGEVLEDLLTYTAQGNGTYKEGLVPDKGVLLVHQQSQHRRLYFRVKLTEY